MNPPEPLDALEAPPSSFDPVTRLAIDLEARLQKCPQCQGMQMQLEARPFRNDEGEGRKLRAVFACEASITAMVTPAAQAMVYAYRPCQVAMRFAASGIAADAAAACRREAA